MDESRISARHWEFDHVTARPRHMKSNDMAESAVKTAKELIKKASKDRPLACNPSLQKNTLRRHEKQSSTATNESLNQDFLQTSKQLLKGDQEEKWKMRTKQAFYRNRNAQDLPQLKGNTVCIQPMNNPKEPQKKATVQEQANM